MKRKSFRCLTGLAGTLIAFVSLVPAATAEPAPAAGAGAGAGAGAPTATAEPEHHSCDEPTGPGVQCLSTWRAMPRSTRVHLSAAGPVASPPDVGYGPAEIQAAYELPSTGGADQVIGIVDAYDNPNVEADLAVYRQAWGLPPCTTENGCFTKVDQDGGTNYPVGDPGWGIEIALDVQAVSASCPECKILLVESNDIGFDNMGIAVQTAVRLGADVVSNSYGADEFPNMVDFGAKYYVHPGVPILASSGDRGFRAASYPAVLGTTWAVGGTRLNAGEDGGFVEEAWSGAGSACSALIEKPTSQTDPNCAMRTVSDISATADSDEGFAVYNTYEMGNEPGWMIVGGTSLAAPLIAGMIGLAGNAAEVADPAYLYAHPEGLHDVVGGENGYCGGDYLCTGLPGYDAPTGLGSPRGLGSL